MYPMLGVSQASSQYLSILSHSCSLELLMWFVSNVTWQHQHNLLMLKTHRRLQKHQGPYKGSKVLHEQTVASGVQMHAQQCS